MFQKVNKEGLGTGWIGLVGRSLNYISSLRNSNSEKSENITCNTEESLFIFWVEKKTTANITCDTL